jgi:glycosyltransferase involved in cell wall biosynthesis
LLQEEELLVAAGHEVAVFATADPRNIETAWSPYFARGRRYERASVVTRVRDSAAAVYSWDVRRRLRALLADFEPDVAHLHNVYHQLTLSVVDELRATGIPSVMTLHDYKPVCPNYRLLAPDGLCQRCVGGSPLNATLHRCLKGSIAASALGTLEAYVTRFGRQYSKVDRFIAPSSFMRDVVSRGGLPHERIDVIPNAVQTMEPHVRTPAHPARFVFMGRLVEEKGVSILLEAVRRATQPVVVDICGAGPLEGDLRTAACDLPVTLHGSLDRPALDALLATATAHVLPSTWFENCPMAVLEASAVGVPTIASSLGGTPELITHDENGLLVEAGDVAALAAAIDKLALAPDSAERLGAEARRRAQRDHQPATHLSRLLAVYGLAEAHAIAPSEVMAVS